MSDTALSKIENELARIGQELWQIDGSDEALDMVLRGVSRLKAQVEVQKSLQITANLLRKQPISKALPRQQATKVKHFVRFVFRKQSRGGDRPEELRKLPCDAVKLCGLSYTTEEIVKLDNLKFEFLKHNVAEFLRQRSLSRLLHRADIDKAVDARVETVDDYEAYESFIQGTCFN